MESNFSPNPRVVPKCPHASSTRLYPPQTKTEQGAVWEMFWGCQNHEHHRFFGVPKPRVLFSNQTRTNTERETKPLRMSSAVSLAKRAASWGTGGDCKSAPPAPERPRRSRPGSKGRSLPREIQNVWVCGCGILWVGVFRLLSCGLLYSVSWSCLSFRLSRAFFLGLLHPSWTLSKPWTTHSTTESPCFDTTSAHSARMQPPRSDRPNNTAT